MFFRWLVLGKGGVDDVGSEPADSSDNAVSVAMAHWNVEHRVFAVEQFFRNSDSVVTVRRLFRQKFDVERQGAIIDRNTILRWVEAFSTTGSVMKRKPPGLQLCRKKCWSVRCRTLRRGSECVRQEGRHLILFSVRNLVRTLKMH